MEAQENIQLIAYCGLYCGNCGSYKKGKCPGCAKNEKAGWCKIRSCCMENNYASCANCTITTPEQCKQHNSLISKFFSLVFKSDRPASLRYIRENGSMQYISRMSELNQMVIKRNQKNVS